MSVHVSRTKLVFKVDNFFQMEINNNIDDLLFIRVLHLNENFHRALLTIVKKIFNHIVRLVSAIVYRLLHVEHLAREVHT